MRIKKKSDGWIVENINWNEIAVTSCLSQRWMRKNRGKGGECELE